MNELQGNGHTSSLATSAVNAALGTSKEEDEKRAQMDAQATSKDEGESDDKDESENKAPLMYYVLEGPYKTFKTKAQAEKYLNAESGPKTWEAFRGRPVATSQKVTLR